MKKVLIIEDDYRLRDTIYELLKLKNYELQIAEDGFTGYIKAKKFKPDIILCDIMMPRIDGFNVLSLIREDENLADMPFIFISGKAEKDAFRTAMQLGADDFLTKPFVAKDLFGAIEARLNTTKSDAPAEVATIDASPETESSSSAGKIAIPTLEGLEMLDLHEIIRCEAQRSYSKFHLVGKQSILVSKPMKKFEEVLCKNKFTKVHRSNIVNIEHITRYVKGSGGYLIMTDNSSVSVSPAFKEKLLARL